MQILDHGYLKYIEHWGSDERIIEAARMSVDKGFLGWREGHCLECEKAGRLDPRDKLFISYEKQQEAMGTPGYGLGTEPAKACTYCKGSGKAVGDEKLLQFLYANKHTTPFEMCGLVIEVKAPILVFREWHRHRTQSYNEMSARYIPLPNENYIPSVERLLQAYDGKNKQSGTIKDAGVLDLDKALLFQEQLAKVYEAQEDFYQGALLLGVPKELARVVLPVGRYSRMRASANLLNWLKFLTLRCDSKAQWEIRQYAEGIRSLLGQHFPRTMELFNGSK